MLRTFILILGYIKDQRLAPFLFKIVWMYSPWTFKKRFHGACLFANDFVLIDETREGMNKNLERWREKLMYNGFRLSRSNQNTWSVHLAEGNTGHQRRSALTTQQYRGWSSLNI